VSVSAYLFIRYINHFPLFYGAFAEPREAAISFVMSVCLPVSIELLSSHGTDFQKKKKI
jgi:hypothetical protein